MDLHPAIELIARNNPNARREKIRSKTLPIAYRFTLESNCTPTSIEAVGIHMVTGSRVPPRLAPENLRKRLSEHYLDPNRVFHMVVDEVSAHPWAFTPPAPQLVRLGPGELEITKTFGRPSNYFGGNSTHRSSSRGCLFGRIEKESEPEKPFGRHKNT